MSSAQRPGTQIPEYSPGPAILSYLIPGLGQIVQGRVGKGLLFLVCLYGLFFYGMALGEWKNVYLPDTAKFNNTWGLPTPAANVYNRLHFAGQFWIGIAAWPAIWQYNHLPVPSEEKHAFWHNFQRTPPESLLNELQTNGDKTWDLGWVFTVIAGVLNVLVIYDAFAGPAFKPEQESQPVLQEAAA
jgi:hypothetical protein